jgi:hypothetical protein
VRGARNGSWVFALLSYDLAVQRIRVECWGDLQDAVAALGFAQQVPALVVVGAAARLSDAELESLEPLFEGLAAVVERTGAIVVDGGTDAGVMRLLGRARARSHKFPLVGVVVAALSGPSGADELDGQWPLEPNHSHVLLVPGRAWGDEAPWLARVATLLAKGARSVTVLVNGGEGAYADVEASLSERRRVVVALGTGGTADALAAAVGGDPGGHGAWALANSELVSVVDIRQDGGQPLFTEIERILSPTGASNG